MFLVIKIRYIYLCATLIMFFVIISSMFILGGNTSFAYLNLKGKTIVIDPGHGGFDGGAVSADGVSEKNINLAISMQLKKYIENSGGNVIITRDGDYALNDEKSVVTKQKKRSDLVNRKDIINSSKGDFLISIHLNFFSETKYKGAQVFYEPVHNQSKILAELLQSILVENLDKENNRVASKISDSKFLYKDLQIPAVIVECGFLSNEKEAKLLNDKSYQKRIAYSLYTGICKYYTTTDKQVKNEIQ